MKVHEIIVESNTLEEGSLLRALLGKPIGFIAKFIRNSNDKKAVISALATLAHPTTGKIDLTNPAAQAAVARFGDGIIRKAETLAKETKFANDLATIKQSMSSVSGAATGVASSAVGAAKKFGSTINGLLKFATVVGIEESVRPWIMSTKEAYDALQNGTMTQEEYDKILSTSTTKCITDVAKQLLTIYGINKTFGLVGWLASLGGIIKIPALSSLATTSSLAAKAYFVNNISSPNAMEAVATLVLSPILSTVYSLTSSIPGVDYVKHLVNDAEQKVNGIVTGATDIAKKIPTVSSTTTDAKPADSSQPVSPNAPSKFVSSTTPMTPADWAALKQRALHPPQSSGN